MPSRVRWTGALALCLSACAGSPPPIGRNLPSEFAKARPAFDERVKTRFPVGSLVSDMLAELNRESFRVDTPAAESLADYKFSATHETHNIACRVSWTVWWNAEAGRIVAVEGDYGASCL